MDEKKKTDFSSKIPHEEGSEVSSHALVGKKKNVKKLRAHGVVVIDRTTVLMLMVVALKKTNFRFDVCSSLC